MCTGHRHTNREFLDLARTKLPEETFAELCMDDWKCEPAQSQTDIIWYNLNHNRCVSFFRTLFVLFLVFIISVGICTPALFITIGLKTIEKIDLNEVSHGFLNKMTMSNYMITAMTVLCNLIILPSIIEYTSLLEHFYTNS